MTLVLWTCKLMSDIEFETVRVMYQYFAVGVCRGLVLCSVRLPLCREFCSKVRTFTGLRRELLIVLSGPPPTHLASNAKLQLGRLQ